MNELEREAASSLIQRDLHDKLERRKIAHLEFEEDRPISPNDISEALAGNEES
ncbi:hypothetical protein [Sharpea azabuensis]|uniref:hypothetical protein n=1 Tax=Sharpea azabuensis TaxID=322505 RepID=UPI0015697915|nr:hypothetical protein [Sharpea azabuensis]